ncbi:MAG: hypothetical protein CVV61_06360 [Tenericutes bacterium HGW-Tenericutes-6]|jgi:hypothetical protein|nr:MAG: hypothetical protein CVV61_06360 [Tenericutes bacterium HGW-Tenericutes-6]
MFYPPFWHYIYTSANPIFIIFKENCLSRGTLHFFKLIFVLYNSFEVDSLKKTKLLQLLLVQVGDGMVLVNGML